MQASTETDGRLNYKEVIENPYVLYTAVMNSIMSFTSYPGWQQVMLPQSPESNSSRYRFA
ncbi:hypothetical protein MUK42_09201 [Musa troglodytarum]|uniref:Uncharacterized protein n=1 Tax=Musa troglodytarum TaxID=320322 RepID=A0A9E7KJP7_9LILI|nr:hypothetical protein MUK42_09201 [Musa troglodytarum]